MQQRQINRGNKSINYTLPAPIGGLNVRDSLDTMSPTDAIILDNYIPLDTKIALRKGYNKYVTTGYTVQTLVEYKRPGDNRFLAISKGKLYDISNKNEVKSFDDIEFNESRCQTMQYKDRLFLMSGNEVPKVYSVADDGVASLTDWGFANDNMQPERIISGTVSKQFLWFVEKGSLNVWYSANAGNVQGELLKFDLSNVVRFGGYLVAVANWTQDGGQGIDDLTVFITSEGEVLVYAGSNPNNAELWALKGSYKMSKPIGYQCILPYQGDIIVISEDGYIPLSKALPMESANSSQVAFSDKIRGLVLERTATGKTKTGWQGLIYGRGGYAIFNVPVSNQFEQHVVNINTGAWCRFVNIRSRCWAMFDNRIYFGGDDGIYLFDEGYSDNGLHIEGCVEQAFSNLGFDGLKKIQLINPRTKSSSRYALTIYTNMDFENKNIKYKENIGSIGMTKWNQAKWSSLSNPIGTKWATLKGKIRSQWIANSATGFKASIVFKTKTRGNLIEWYDTGVRYERGSGIV